MEISKQNKFAQLLRQRIVATASAKWHWSIDDLHSYMIDWGYGASLRILNIYQLQEILKIVAGNGQPLNPEFSSLNQQQKYCWHLMKKVGWSFQKLQKFWQSKFQKSNFSELDDGQLGATVRMLTKYDKGDIANNKEV